MMLKKKMLTSLSLCLACMSQLASTPSNLFWTNCTTDVLAQGAMHLNVDNYFSVGNHKKNKHSFPVDIGFESGLYSYNDVSVEWGVDYLGGVNHPLLFNAKVGVPEGKFFENAPSFSIGIFNIGTSHKRNQSVCDVVLGYTLPQTYGKVYVGGYHGKHALGSTHSGMMLGYKKALSTETISEGKTYDKWLFIADYASGKNAIGGGGAALQYYFTPKINMETGPVIFNDRKINGRWKWSLQLNFDI
jgi:hypothetical protein